MIIVGSFLVVVSAVEVVTGLRSLETRESVETFLSEAPSTLGLDVEQVLQILRATALVTAACAAAAAVLGWHVLQRNRGARVGLTVLAVPLFLSGLVTGGFTSSLVAAASLLLWLQPARNWFAGKPAPAVPDQRVPWPPVQASVESSAPPAENGSGTTGADPEVPDQGARPVHGFGDQPSWEAPGAVSLTKPAAPGAAAPGGRPGAVVAAAVLTWVCAGFTLLSTVGSMVLVGTSPDAVMEELEKQQPDLLEQEGVTQDLVVNTVLGVGAVVALWCLVAIVAAVLVMRRRPGGRSLLLGSAVATAVFGLVGALSAPPMILAVLAGAVVFVLLRRPDVQAWFQSR